MPPWRSDGGIGIAASVGSGKLGVVGLLALELGQHVLTYGNGEQLSHLALQPAAANRHGADAGADGARARLANRTHHINYGHPAERCRWIEALGDEGRRLAILGLQQGEITRPLRAKPH